MNPDIPMLDSTSCPLNGVCMIEAAAGTGKTYNIQNLVLRLILEQDIPISGILVVTFTEAATAELRTRIRDMLRNALNYAAGSAIPEKERPRIKAIMEHAAQNTPGETLVRRLRNAFIDFDSSTISTIHGFCQRMLTENAFESGVLFNTVIQKDQDEIILDLLTDFYRREFYAPDHGELRAALQDYTRFTPDLHFRTICALLARPDLRIRTRARKPYDTRPIMERISGLLDETAALFEPGLLTGFGNLMKKGYYPEDCAEAEELLLSWKKEGTLYQVPNTLSRFTTEQIRQNAKVKFRIRIEDHLNHPFFAKNDLLQTEFQAYSDTILFAALKYVKHEFALKKRRENFQTFDDLLRRVRDGILDENGLLAPAIRKKYRAAVVDEFQDTDPVQYDIFHRLFACRQDPALFMVGDPRQAIYAFRGGDMATYRKAERECLELHNGRKYGLVQNFRSSAPVIRAVNAIFHDHPFPFADPDITFSEIQAPADDSGKQRAGIQFHGREEPAPLKFTWLPPENRDPTAAQLADRTIRLCAKQIRKMLDDPAIRLPDRESPGVMPGDFAVLVFTAFESERVQEALAEYHIPSVIAKSGNVFDSVAAEELETVLNAVAAPADARLAVRAMNTELIGYEIPELVEMHLDDGDTQNDVPLNGVQEKLESLLRRWENASFIEMFHDLLAEFNVRERILKKNLGERKLTDLLQLREILHNEISTRRLSVSGTLSFLKRQRSERMRDKKEEYEILLETDRAAVTIMTVHKSKGLEYPLVLLPTLFTWNAEKFAENYHLPDGSIERDFTGSAESEALASAERLQELLRLAYVAITRAKYYCHIYWGACRSRTSALDWLFRMRTLKSLPELRDMRNLLNSSQESVLNAIPADWLAEPVPETEILTPYTVKQAEAETLNPPHWNGKIDYAWHITSYSGLTPHGGDAPSDYDSEDDEAPVERRMTGIFSIPGGAQTGNAWHEILEKLDFTDHERRLPGLIEEKLSLYGLLKNDARKEERIALTAEMIGKVLASPLADADGQSFTLSEIPRADRISEMEFHYRFRKGFRVDQLRTVLEPYIGEKFGGAAWDSLHGFISGGFLNGFIDLVFRLRGRFYIIDWKSNRLGGSPQSFRQDGIRSAMLKHFYFLQYLIYSVALVKFLRLKNGSFTEQDHEKYFGGVYYLFLRGITPEAPGNGIYRDRPPFALLMQLEQLIG